MAWPREMPVVMVTWVDSNGHSGWRKETDREKDLDDDTMLCVSTGFLFRQDARSVAVALDASETGQIGDTMHIPASAVRDIVVLRPAQPWPGSSED